jgi:hypothetical protein
METKSFFGESGLTSTSANHYANLAKEMTRRIKERLDSIHFFETNMSIVGDEHSTVVSRGTFPDEFTDIKKGLETITGCNSLIAFFREAIKEKERLAHEAESWTDVERRADLDNRSREHALLKPKRGTYMDSDDVIRSWSVGEQERYLSLEAEASVYGKFIHEDGRLSKARTELIKVNNNPTLVKENGRDTVIYNYIPTVTQFDVDDLFFELQNHYREVQAELNGMKKRIDDAIKENALAVDEDFRNQLTAWSSKQRSLEHELELIVADESVQRKKLAENVQKLKIVVPNRLKDIFTSLQELG